ncbi:hypothetical protein [Clostridium estertheticum]|uniref:hypothetical protein n=1 Tax=Clostridium estertheticum TaxID=238834 RepID=UPI001C6F39AF|nr:hypothetical protein [Clostridium estertheticum]MBW9150989.1 hypothetical protein [Clostridium estertheticum]WLC84300.1 hypothetical protein KTC97_00315 [Clostridium estertheticum]
MDKYLIDNALYTSKFTSRYLKNQIDELVLAIQKYTTELSLYESKVKICDEKSDTFKSFQFSINNTKVRINTANQIKKLFEEEIELLNKIYTKFTYQENIMTEPYNDKIVKNNSLILNNLLKII